MQPLTVHLNYIEEAIPMKKQSSPLHCILSYADLNFYGISVADPLARILDRGRSFGG
jgi:hypothetical protein